MIQGLSTLITFSCLFLYSVGHAQNSRFTDLTHKFSVTESLTEKSALHRSLSAWAETFSKIDLNKSFESTNTHGFALFVTTVRYKQDLSVLDRSIFNHPVAQQQLFPNVRFYDCTETFCKAEQEVGVFLPKAHYRSHYRFMKLNNLSEMKASNIPTVIFTDTLTFPKYVVLQVATDWSEYFHRANSVTVFEPDTKEGWVRIGSYQTISLTRVGSIGRWSLKSALEDQAQKFLQSFGRL